MTIVTRQWEDSSMNRRTVAALDPAEVQVWLANVPTEEDQGMLLTRHLVPDELARAARFARAAPRREFVAGRAVLRQILGASLAIEPTAVGLAATARGKLHLAGHQSAARLQFNVAHSGGLVAVALARDRAVGVDIEWMKPLEDWRQLAPTIFSQRELTALQSCPPALQRAAFFHGWTRKEAWLKATGEGLNDHLPSIEVTLAPGETTAFLALPGGAATLRQWGIAALPVPADYAGAVVWETKNPW